MKNDLTAVYLGIGITSMLAFALGGPIGLIVLGVSLPALQHYKK